MAYYCTLVTAALLLWAFVILPTSVFALVPMRLHKQHLLRQPSGLYLSSPDAMTATDTSATTRPALGLITFDLDDTLFPSGPVVEDANRAMIQAMRRLGYGTSSNENVLKHTAAIRKSLKGSITYTDLRLRAIQQEMECQAENIDRSVFEHCFDAWLEERQRSAERNLYPDAVSMLEELSETHPYACIGAVTNGRGNPMDMPSLKRFFDFCVSGEDDGVFPERKPRPGIYKASLAAYHDRYPHTIDESSHVWVHVGDCLANDVGASAKCGAYAVWKAPIQLENDKNEQPFWSTASKRTIENRKRLANQGRGKMSAQISNLRELPAVVDEILETVALGHMATMTRHV